MKTGLYEISLPLKFRSHAISSSAVTSKTSDFDSTHNIVSMQILMDKSERMDSLLTEWRWVWLEESRENGHDHLTFAYSMAQPGILRWQAIQDIIQVLRRPWHGPPKILLKICCTLGHKYWRCISSNLHKNLPRNRFRVRQIAYNFCLILRCLLCKLEFKYQIFLSIHEVQEALFSSKSTPPPFPLGVQIL